MRFAVGRGRGDAVVGVVLGPGDGVDDLTALEDHDVVGAAGAKTAVLIEQVRKVAGFAAGERVAPAAPDLGLGHAGPDRLDVLRPDSGGAPRAGRRRGQDRSDSHQRLPASDCHAASEVKKPRPSWVPCSGSIAFSGCGIRPTTVPAGLQIPAMLRSEPLGLGSTPAPAWR